MPSDGAQSMVGMLRRVLTPEPSTFHGSLLAAGRHGECRMMAVRSLVLR